MIPFVAMLTMVVPFVRPGTYAAVRVDPADAGPAYVDGGAGRTAWESDGTPATVPALVPPGVTSPWRLESSAGDLVADVTVLRAGDRLVLDATAAGVPTAVVEAVASADARVARVPADANPVGLAAADAVVFDAEPPDAAAWRAAGVDVAWVEGDALRLLNAPRPAVLAVAEWPYAAVQSWDPARPARERAAVVAVIALAVPAVLLRRRRLALAAVVVLAGGLVAWRLARPAVAVREATLPTGGGAGDRWIFLKAPSREGPTAASVAFAGHTLPVGFSAGHLARLSPTLQLDGDGRPARVELTIPAGSVAAVVQCGVTDAGSPPAWASRLDRRYARDDG